MIGDKIKAQYYGIIERMVDMTPNNTALGRNVRRFVSRHRDEERYTTVRVVPKIRKRRKSNSTRVLWFIR